LRNSKRPTRRAANLAYAPRFLASFAALGFPHLDDRVHPPTSKYPYRMLRKRTPLARFANNEKPNNLEAKLRTIICPSCSNSIAFNKQWTVVCRNCQRVVKTRAEIYPLGHYQNGSNEELLHKFIEYVEINTSPENWGFHKNVRLPSQLTVIYDSEFCRVKFKLSYSDHGPLYATSIFYGRRHAPDTQQHMTWHKENCLCWHSNMLGLTLPFLEGVPPRQLAENSGDFQKSLENSFNAFPTNDIEPPLELHSKIWEEYGQRLFSIFDLRKPELWDEYSKYSNEFHGLINKSLNERFNIFREIEKIC